MRKVFQYILYPYVNIFTRYYIRKYKISDVVKKDVERMAIEYGFRINRNTGAKLFLYPYSCFRDVFYFRCNDRCRLLSFFFKRYPLLTLNKGMKAEGGAFYFHHPYATYINAEYVGYGCTFRNNTTIGNTAKGKPSLLGGADIGVNSCIVGGITLGYNVKVEREQR